MLELDTNELEMEKKIAMLTENWGTDEMIDLLLECEMVLSYNEGRIKQLSVKGLKRLWHIISGIYSKNVQSVRENVQEIQKISFKIQKILLRRVNLIRDALISLNRKVNLNTCKMQDIIYNLLLKLDGIQQNVDDAAINIALMKWYYSLKNKEIENGKGYLDVPDGMRILLVVSDLYQIVHKRVDLIDKSELKTALQDLGLDGTIRNTDFYGDIIKEQECLSLYVKNYYDYETESISLHGQIIYKISEFYSNPLLEEMSGFIDKPLEKLCQQIISKKIQNMTDRISPVDLCMKLLNDLVRLNSIFQKEMEEQASLDENLILEEKYEEKECDKTKYSILRMTPEELHLFKGKENILNQLNCKDEYKYTFRDQEMLRAYIEISNPYMVTAPVGYFNSCLPEIKEILTKKTVYVSLADYYMYLWFCCTDEEKKMDQKLAFLEYYDEMVYVSVYVVNTKGNSYKKGVSKTISGKRSIPNIMKDILSHEDFSGVNKNDILIFQTFRTDEQNLYKLERDHNVKIVDSKWEDIWNRNNEDLGNIIHDLIEKTTGKEQF